MQTLIIKIQDGFLQDFLTFVEHYKDKIQIEKDPKLLQDPYFYERQKLLVQDLEEIENTKAEMIGNEEFWNEIDTFAQLLQK